MSDDEVLHGGTDAGPPIRWDFSTNANPVPPCAEVVQALRSADRQRYPDPTYSAVRARLAQQWSCPTDSVNPTAGSAEAIRRLTLAASLSGVRTVWVPEPGYGDYRAAATALGLSTWSWRDESELRVALSSLVGDGEAHAPVLCWICEPNNPTGHRMAAATWHALEAAMDAGASFVLALDLAYVPLAWHHREVAPATLLRRSWRLWSPNKALGVTGVRAGALQAPVTEKVDATRAVRPGDAMARAIQMAEQIAARVAALAPSWVVSAEGVALLTVWHSAPVQHWLQQARAMLWDWAMAQRAMLSALGWQCAPSETPFFLAAPPWLMDGAQDAPDPAAVARSRALDEMLRTECIRLRRADDFGLAGWFRLSVQPPPAQTALRRALARFQRDAAGELEGLA